MRQAHGLDRENPSDLPALRTAAMLANEGGPMMEYYDPDYVANVTAEARYLPEEIEEGPEEEEYWNEQDSCGYQEADA